MAGGDVHVNAWFGELHGWEDDAGAATAGAVEHEMRLRANGVYGRLLRAAAKVSEAARKCSVSGDARYDPRPGRGARGTAFMY